MASLRFLSLNARVYAQTAAVESRWVHYIYYDRGPQVAHGGWGYWVVGRGVHTIGDAA